MGYIPLAAGYAIATGGGPPNTNLFDPMLNPASIIALSTWRITQSVYRFDPDLLEELITQPFEGDLPCEAFKRLPEWCVYIEFGTKPQLKHIYAEAEGPARDIENKTFDGFFAHLEYDVKDNRTSPASC